MSDSAAATSARERAANLLDPLIASGEPISGFTVERREEIPELDVTAYVLRHRASGARLLHLASEDENKAFAIGFKTPPTDSTGVFHILEHSVLCGSAKFPVKEPFADLIKSSMQTFLNAMTYPDKTVYPVASTNEQDLLNLMDVYMDAVLNPAIYTKPSIFEQEGWHLELDVPEGAAASDPASKLRYNGVVYNEMKGALSDPMSVLDDAVAAALFPDTAYACESGGDPRHIPDLTYQAFLDNHARHYNLANSYITLYGDLDVARVLAFLEERYLGDEVRERDAAARRSAAPDPAAIDRALAAGPNPLLCQEPVACDYRRIKMTTAPEHALAGMAYALGADALDRKRVIGAGILFEALLGSNEAPVKKAILAAGLGGNVISYTQSACLQPYELIILQGAKEDAARELRRVIEDECRRLVEEGIPRARLEAVLSSNEFDLRQRDFGTADGVVLACDALSTWLYDDDAATLALSYGPVYAELHRELEGSFFEDLLREIVLESGHHALVELVPVDEPAADAPGADLEGKRAAMDDDELDRVVENVAALRRVQEAPDTPEAKATLPRLRVSDIGPARPEPALTVDTTAPITCLKHAIPTRGIAYLTLYFDLTHVSFAELAYASVMANLLQQLATKRRSADELDSHITANLGFLSFSTAVFQQPDWRLARPVLKMSAAALSEKLEHLVEIPREVWSETLFEDEGRIRDVLGQLKIRMEQSFLNSGHLVALSRAMSYVSPAAVASQQMGGVDFYRFVSDLLEHFDERKGELIERMRNLQERVFTSTGLTASFTGSDEDYARFWEMGGALGLTKRTAPEKELMVRWPEPKSEAFVIPSDVCYAARATDPRVLGIETNGTWNVASQVLSYDYLWNEIRVKGGAYGCGFRARDDRQLAFYTYRDPALDASQVRIAGAGEWLAAFEPDEAAFEGFIVSTAAGFDAPLKPFALALRQDGEFFSRRPAGWRATLREQVLQTTPSDLRRLGAEITRAAAEAPLCVFGSREIIEASELDLNVVELLG
ncbi:MAG: peptidase M16 [Coriobacteriaceae bacterium]|nr:peptidase M16 [Coriobacteriaceae bacterium]